MASRGYTTCNLQATSTDDDHLFADVGKCKYPQFDLAMAGVIMSPCAVARLPRSRACGTAHGDHTVGRRKIINAASVYWQYLNVLCDMSDQ